MDDTSPTSRGPVLVRHPIRPELDGLVAGIVGFSERAAHPVVRRQVAGSLLPLVLSSGPVLEVLDLSDGVGTGPHSSFVVGFMPGHATTSFDTDQLCLQIYLTPLGAFHLLGLPGRELVARVVDVAEAAPMFDRSLIDELWCAPTWHRRFAIIDRRLLSLRDHPREPEPFVTWMWQEIQRTGGTARIGDLVEQTGWSQRHVIALFTEQIGLGPKAASRVVRFEQALDALGRYGAAEVAARFGYADQSHLAREIRRFAGMTPTALSRTAPPTAHSAIGPR